MRLKAEENANLFKFFSMVKTIVENTMPDIRLFSGDKPPVNVETPVITYRVRSKEPFRELKPRIREIIQDPFNPGYDITIWGWWFNHEIRFHCWDISSSKSQEIADRFEDNVMAYFGVLKERGVSEIFYLGRIEDREEVAWRDDLDKTTCVFRVRLEKIIPVSEKVLEKITIKFSQAPIDLPGKLIIDESYYDDFNIYHQNLIKSFPTESLKDEIVDSKLRIFGEELYNGGKYFFYPNLFFVNSYKSRYEIYINIQDILDGFFVFSIGYKEESIGLKISRDSIKVHHNKDILKNVIYDTLDKDLKLIIEYKDNNFFFSIEYDNDKILDFIFEKYFKLQVCQCGFGVEVIKGAIIDVRIDKIFVDIRSILSEIEESKVLSEEIQFNKWIKKI